MKNKEKSFDKVCEIACSGGGLAVTKNGEAVQCNRIACNKCIFGYSRGDCISKAREWLESECIEQPVISKRDRVFLMYLREELKSIARDKDGKIFAFTGIAKKDEDRETFVYEGVCRNISYSVNIDFPMVKWSDDSPWLIEDLKKLEVVDSYE